MKLLTDLVTQLLSRTEYDWQIKLRADWVIIMGDVSKRARLERINGSTVVIGVYDTHWMHELHALSRIMLQRINNALSSLYPEGFMLTAVRCIWVVKKEKKIYHTPLVAHQQLVSTAPTVYALQAVQKLVDKELQQSLIAYYRRCKESLS